MKDVIKMLKVIEKDLAKAIKLLGNAPAKAPVLKLVKPKRDGKKLEQIRAMIAKGKKPADIAAKFGVSIAYVYGVKSKDKKAAS